MHSRVTKTFLDRGSFEYARETNRYVREGCHLRAGASSGGAGQGDAQGSGSQLCRRQAITAPEAAARSGGNSRGTSRKPSIPIVAGRSTNVIGIG